VAESTIK